MGREGWCPGTIERDVGTQTIRFAVTDGQVTYPVVYRGLAPDTFTDDVEVVVEGRLQPDGPSGRPRCSPSAVHAYEAVPKA